MREEPDHPDEEPEASDQLTDDPGYDYPEDDAWQQIVPPGWSRPRTGPDEEAPDA